MSESQNYRIFRSGDKLSNIFHFISPCLVFSLQLGPCDFAHSRKLNMNEYITWFL